MIVSAIDVPVRVGDKVLAEISRRGDRHSEHRVRTAEHSVIVKLGAGLYVKGHVRNMHAKIPAVPVAGN